MKQPISTNGRLASLDILRGLVIFMLVFLQPVVVAWGKQLDWPWMEGILYQLDHAPWEGFRCWDLVMPLFLFMTGVSLPFSLGRFKKEKGNRGKVYWKIIRRFLLLYLLGMVVQGNLLAFDVQALKLFSNTLQAIAVGYLVTALVFLNFSFRGQGIIAVLLLAAYSVPMMCLGNTCSTR